FPAVVACAVRGRRFVFSAQHGQILVSAPDHEPVQRGAGYSSTHFTTGFLNGCHWHGYCNCVLWQGHRFTHTEPWCRTNRRLLKNCHPERSAIPPGGRARVEGQCLCFCVPFAFPAHYLLLTAY